MLLALLSGGLAHASYSFDGAPRASDEELDLMRGGFVVSWNGLEFLMPFAITGIERLTQVGNQTYINGELMSPRLNPQALIPLSQMNQISVGVQTRTSDLASSGSGGTGGAPTGGSAAGIGPASTGGSPAASSTADAGKGSATNGVIGAGSSGTQVTANGSLIVIQNGSANAVALPPNISLDSLATFIQNSVNNQVIRNITTMNITIEAQMLAAQARLNAILNQSLNGLH
ncbi:MAG: hypothetical protein WBZ31_03555 [Thiobacillus sp.]